MMFKLYALSTVICIDKLPNKFTFLQILLNVLSMIGRFSYIGNLTSQDCLKMNIKNKRYLI